MPEPIITRWRNEDGSIDEAILVEQVLELLPGRELLTAGWRRKDHDTRTLFERDGDVPDELKAVHVSVGWNDDYESTFLSETTPGDSDDTERMFDAWVPKTMWDAYRDARAEGDRIHDELVARVGVDVAAAEVGTFRLLTSCPSWRGTGAEPSITTHWAAFPDPRRDVGEGDLVRIFHDSDETVVRQRIAQLPGRFTAIQHGELIEVERGKLVVDSHTYTPHTSRCHRCGWERSDHADAGQATT